jgi:PiT family inorganic phosphate transporter
LATLLGLPISTTHALTEAIVGAGLLSVGGALNVSVVAYSFLGPLLIAPALAIILTIPLYQLLHWLVRRFGLERTTCICLGPAHFVRVSSLQLTAVKAHYGVAIDTETGAVIQVASPQHCVEKYNGQLLGVSIQSLVDLLHQISAAAVSFARGLNDTPKIVPLLLVVDAFDIRLGVFAVDASMAIGGLLSARKVAQTMSKKISCMYDGQSLTANLVTAGLVIFASRVGVPVSTTHVSVSAIIGIGLANGAANKNVVSAVLASWLLTLPLAAMIGAAYVALFSVG